MPTAPAQNSPHRLTFRTGDRVRCCDARASDNLLQHGATYTVAKAGDAEIQLVELGRWWRAERFRPAEAQP